MRRLITRHPGHRACGILEALLAAGVAPALARSQAEERFLALVRKAQLPAPELNVRLGPFEVDFLWRTEQLAVEVDGYAFHASPALFERDRRKDARLSAAGVQVLRVTWRQLTSEPEAVLVRLAQTLVRSSVRSSRGEAALGQP